MAADNAIIIGMVAANFAPKNRKQIILWGVLAAFIFRIIFAFSATYLLQFAFIKLLGGALLLWVIHSLREDLFNTKKIKSPTKKSKEPSFISGVYKVLIADITLSFDNVLGVAGAAKDHYTLLVFGLILSIILMATVANVISKWIKKYKWIGWLGLLAIIVVAVELIYSDLKVFL